MAKATTPPKLEEAIVKELAVTPRGEHGAIKRMANDFGVSEFVIKHIQQRKKKDIQELRAIAAEDGMEIVLGLHQRMREKLEDPVEMAKTPLRDVALSVEKLTNASVTAADGHAPAATINIGFVKDGMAALTNYDQVIAEKRARAKLVEAPALPVAAA